MLKEAILALFEEDLIALYLPGRTDPRHYYHHYNLMDERNHSIRDPVPILIHLIPPSLSCCFSSIRRAISTGLK
jgi:hypothetical protein